MVPLFDNPAGLKHDDLVGLRTVDSRCAMTSVVRPTDNSSSACWTSRSLCASSALVASSRSRIGALRRDGGRWPRAGAAPDRGRAARPGRRIQPLRQPVGEIGDMGGDDGAAQRGIVLIVTQKDVLAQGFVKQRRVLADGRELVAQRRRSNSRSGTPPSVIRPAAGSIIRVSRLKTVDFPAPRARPAPWSARPRR